MIFSIYDFIAIFFAIISFIVSIFSILKSSYYLKFSNISAFITRKDFKDCSNIYISGSLTIANLGSVTTAVKINLFINDIEFGTTQTLSILGASKEPYSFEFSDSLSNDTFKKFKLVVSSPSKDKPIFFTPIYLMGIDPEIMRQESQLPPK